MTERQIVAGGEPWGSPGAAKFLAYLKGIVGDEAPRISFLPTAAGDSDSYVAAFLVEMLNAGFKPSVAKLFDRAGQDLRSRLLDQDLIYVGGGNTANMLAVWRTHGVDELLREAWENGVILTGTSAGANCWFEASVTDSFGPLGPLRDGLGFLAGSYCPHYDSEPERRPTFETLIASGFPEGYAADDTVALHFVGTDLREVVAPDEESYAYRVTTAEGSASEARLKPRLLK